MRKVKSQKSKVKSQKSKPILMTEQNGAGSILTGKPGELLRTLKFTPPDKLSVTVPVTSCATMIMHGAWCVTWRHLVDNVVYTGIGFQAQVKQIKDNTKNEDRINNLIESL